MTPTLILAVLGLAGCFMALVAVLLDDERPNGYDGWTLKGELK